MPVARVPREKRDGVYGEHRAVANAVHATGFSELTRRDPGLTVRRRFRCDAPGLIRLDQWVMCDHCAPGIDVTGPYWMFALVIVKCGELSYRRGCADVTSPGRRFAVFLPPYSIVECLLDCVQSRSIAFVSRQVLPTDLPTEAVAFVPVNRAYPTSVAQIVETIRDVRHFVSIGREQQPSRLSKRLKQLLDREYADLPTLSTLATRWDTSASLLSRYFKRDYGIPPIRYRHCIRVTDAIVRLVQGEPVAAVAGTVGFEDLGQFYRQFSALACGSPGRYRPRSRNPKIRC